MTAIEITGLRKTFGRGGGKIEALTGLDLCVEEGMVYGLLGRNGVGKTTSLRALAGILTPNGGKANVLGIDMRRATSRDRARMAYIPQEQQLDRSLTGAQIGNYLSCFYPYWDQSLADRTATRFDIPMDRPVGELSGGQQRLMSVILALAGQPEVLLLDEPAAGLDPVARRELIDVLVELLIGEQRPTILLSTHLVADVERLADRVGMMAGGCLHLEADLDELKQSCRRAQVVFEDGAIPSSFAPVGVLRSRQEGAMWSGVVKSDAQSLAALETTPKAHVQLFPLGLEDLFVELFSREDS